MVDDSQRAGRSVASVTLVGSYLSSLMICARARPIWSRGYVGWYDSIPQPRNPGPALVSTTVVAPGFLNIPSVLGSFQEPENQFRHFLLGERRRLPKQLHSVQPDCTRGMMQQTERSKCVSTINAILLDHRHGCKSIHDMLCAAVTHSEHCRALTERNQSIEIVHAG